MLQLGKYFKINATALNRIRYKNHVTLCHVWLVRFSINVWNRAKKKQQHWFVKLTSNSFMGWMHGNHIVFKTAEANWLATVSPSRLCCDYDFVWKHVNSKQRKQTVTRNYPYHFVRVLSGDIEHVLKPLVDIKSYISVFTLKQAI